MSKITIVTAFFDISRSTWSHFSRSAETYLEYFAFWCKIHNDMIIYTSPDYIEEIENIVAIQRSGLRTEIIEVSDHRELDSELYREICKSMSQTGQNLLRLRPDVPESCNHDYNYLTNLKGWFLADAQSRFNLTGFISWVDFGYNHSGKVIQASDDFDFLWCPSLDEKVHLFSIRPLSSLPTFQRIILSTTSIMGAVIIAPANQVSKLWTDWRYTLKALCVCQLADDDQAVLEMMLRKNESNFLVIPSFWHRCIPDLGGHHMLIKPPVLAKWYKRPFIPAVSWLKKQNELIRLALRILMAGNK
ncbi:hypothetical protein N9O86_01125 [Planktomarina temperata]|nr:hypothetical protein [Planktomarina temperata]